MSETKFTPGNWVVVPYGDGDQLVICSDDENWRVAFMATPGASPGAMTKIRADANLLSASKELYEALNRIVEFEGYHGDNVAIDLKTWKSAIEAARSALAKASGASP